MYHVLVVYADKSFTEYSHINKIEFYEASAYKTLEGDAITSHRYLLGNMIYHLFSEDGVSTVSVHNAVSFEIRKEN